MTLEAIVAEANETRILHLTDVHSKEAWDTWCTQIEKDTPDYVLFTGDALDEEVNNGRLGQLRQEHQQKVQEYVFDAIKERFGAEGAKLYAHTSLLDAHFRKKNLTVDDYEAHVGELTQDEKEQEAQYDMIRSYRRAKEENLEKQWDLVIEEKVKEKAFQDLESELLKKEDTYIKEDAEFMRGIFERIYRATGKKVIAVPGNHDSDTMRERCRDYVEWVDERTHYDVEGTNITLVGTPATKEWVATPDKHNASYDREPTVDDIFKLAQEEGVSEEKAQELYRKQVLQNPALKRMKQGIENAKERGRDIWGVTHNTLHNIGHKIGTAVSLTELARSGDVTRFLSGHEHEEGYVRELTIDQTGNTVLVQKGSPGRGIYTVVDNETSATKTQYVDITPTNGDDPFSEKKVNRFWDTVNAN